MKQLEITTNKRLLIVELPENEFSEEKTIKAFIDSQKYINTQLGNNVELKQICKGSELTEEISRSLIKNEISEFLVSWNWDYVSKEPLNDDFFPPMQSFISAIEAAGYHWGENPVKEPRISDYGWYASGHPEEDSGWMYEEGEDKYYEALKTYEESESRTFNPSKCIIFEII